MSTALLSFPSRLVVNITIIADLQVIKDRRQNLIEDETLHCNNLKHYSYDYTPGQQILLRVPDPTKLGSRAVQLVLSQLLKSMLMALLLSNVTHMFPNISLYVTFALGDNKLAPLNRRLTYSVTSGHPGFGGDSFSDEFFVSIVPSSV
jgi:hypothetical protein